MTQASLEERVATLEEQVRELLDRLDKQNRLPNWQATVGMFKDDPLAKEVMDEILAAREEERERARRGDF